MNDLEKIINNYGELKEIKGLKVRYLEIAFFSEVFFSYGVSSIGWIINKDENYFLVKFDDDNYIPFFKLLTLSSETILKKISKNNLLLKIDKNNFDCFFPIKKITLTALTMESSYWADLCLDFLLESEIYLPNLVDAFIEKKWIPQSLRHKMLKYIAKIR